jgi:hypothetical protein
MAKKADIEKFRELCRREYRFLEREYDFTERKIPKEESINQFQVQYVNATTLVAVEGIHWGLSIDVRIGRLLPEAWEIYKHYSLEDLLIIRCPELSLGGTNSDDGSSNQSVELKHYAHALKECADDVLRGEFSVLPQLHQSIVRRVEQFSSGEA